MPSRDAMAAAERAVDVLRLSGNETQLTRAMGLLMHGSGDLRELTARTLLTLCGADASVVDRAALVLTIETPAARTRRFRERRLGRVDWRFSDTADPTRFHLVVEVKIDAAPAPGQFLRYLRDDAVANATSGGVVALTKHPLGSVDLPREVTEHRKWLGALRWHQVLPRLLAGSPSTSDDPNVATWHALLGRAGEQGDLGRGVWDWDELAASRGTTARDRRLQVLRAALDEVRSDIDDPRHPVRFRRVQETWLVDVGPLPVRALAFALHGSRALSLDVTFWPPSRPVPRGQWEAAVRGLVADGWKVTDDRLCLNGVRVEARAEPLHLAVAAAIRFAIRPLGASRVLLPRYLALSAPDRARASHLTFVRAD